MIKISPYLITASLLRLSCSVFAFCATPCLAADVALKISTTAPNTLAITVGEKHQNLRLSHTADGYFVNCNRSILLVWGRPLKINPDNPQDSGLTIIDIGKVKIHKEVFFSKGIHAAEFLSKRPEAIVWTDMGEALDLDTGNILPPPERLEFDSSKYPREACKNFPYKSFNKYPEY